MSLYNNRNKLTEELLSGLVPKMALIAYKGEGDMDNKFYLEARKFLWNGMMGEGVPVTCQFMREIADNYTEAHTGVPYGAIPDNMLYSDTRRGSERYVWYDPPQRRTMFFKKSLGLDNVEYHIPGVIYDAGENRLSIYAYKDKKLTPDSQLFHGPFFNTTDSSVCLGTVKLSKPANPAYGQLTEYWEKRFWCTEFSHLGNGNPTKDNLVVVTKAAIGAPFDPDQLKPANKTLKNLLR